MFWNQCTKGLNLLNPCTLWRCKTHSHQRLCAVQGAGDFVQYREPGLQDTVMTVVIGITSKQARGSWIVVIIQARRLFAYKELLKILGSIAPYRFNLKLRDIRLNASNVAPVLREDSDFKSARERDLFQIVAFFV